MPTPNNLLSVWPIITVTDLPDGCTIIPGTLTETLDSAPSTLTFTIPEVSASQAVGLIGKLVIVTRGGNNIFRGYIRSQSRTTSDSTAGAEFYATDVREDIRYVILGQAGFGDMDSSDDMVGFKGTGFTIHFNPDNMPNRSSSARTVNTDGGALYIIYPGVYRFTPIKPPSYGSYWTYANIITWLFNWYISDELMKLDPAALSNAALSEPAVIRDLTFTSAGEALDEIMRQICGHWTTYYQTALVSAPSDVPYFQPLFHDTDVTTRTIHIMDPTAAPKKTFSLLTASSHRVSTSASASFDRVEVHAGPDHLETFFTDLDSATYAKLVSDSTTQNPEYVRTYTIDIANLGVYFPDAFALNPYYTGDPEDINYAIDTQPPTWLRELVTRDSDGLPLDPADNVYIRLDSDESGTWVRVKSGFKVDYQNAQLLIEPKLTLHPASSLGHERTIRVSGTSFKLGITLAIEATRNTVILGNDEDIYLPHRRTRIVSLPRLHNKYRRYSLVHTTDATNSGHWENAQETLNQVVDISDTLTARYGYEWAPTAKLRQTGHFTLPAMPTIHPGDTVTFSGQDIGMTTARGPYRVDTGVTVDIQTGRVELSVTNGLFASVRPGALSIRNSRYTS